MLLFRRRKWTIVFGIAAFCACSLCLFSGILILPVKAKTKKMLEYVKHEDDALLLGTTSEETIPNGTEEVTIQSLIKTTDTSVKDEVVEKVASNEVTVKIITSTSTVIGQQQDDDYNSCHDIPPYLIGNVNLFEGSSSEDANWPPTLEEIAVNQPGLKLGGYYPGPTNCTTKHRLSIIIPFRDREEHLRYFLHYIHEILQRQQVSYTIYVVEQDNEETFNKGQLMNTGFQYAMNQTTGNDVNCVFFHDVDMISEDDRTLYRCVGDEVVHLSHRVDKFQYVLCCGMTVGGVLGFSPKQFKSINGFSNLYYGWGAEDDDVNARILHVGKYQIYRPQEDYAKFKMIHHERDSGNPSNDERLKLLDKWADRQPTDGLNSLQTQITNVVKYKTHTRIFVKTSSKAK